MKKETKEINNTSKIIEVYDFKKGDITVTVRIDYQNNLISILDQEKGKKNFIFANRGVEYMNGWLNILSTLQDAIKDAKKRYEDNLAETSRFKEDMIIKIHGERLR